MTRSRHRQTWSHNAVARPVSLFLYHSHADLRRAHTHPPVRLNQSESCLRWHLTHAPPYQTERRRQRCANCPNPLRWRTSLGDGTTPPAAYMRRRLLLFLRPCGDVCSAQTKRLCNRHLVCACVAQCVHARLAPVKSAALIAHAPQVLLYRPRLRTCACAWRRGGAHTSIHAIRYPRHPRRTI